MCRQRRERRGGSSDRCVWCAGKGGTEAGTLTDVCGVQAKAGKKRRELQRQVLFTMPVRPRAGQSVRVYYNPDVTPLRGRPETWLRGGWNRYAPENLLHQQNCTETEGIAPDRLLSLVVSTGSAQKRSVGPLLSRGLYCAPCAPRRVHAIYRHGRTGCRRVWLFA